jgi:uncharacterized membrane protein YeaQ/YmgE (transglycosylase-associated protein family)
MALTALMLVVAALAGLLAAFIRIRDAPVTTISSEMVMSILGNVVAAVVIAFVLGIDPTQPAGFAEVALGSVGGVAAVRAVLEAKT